MAVLSHLGPTRQDVLAIADLLVTAVRLVAAVMAGVGVLGLALGDLNSAAALLLGSATGVLVTAPLRAGPRPSRQLTWTQAFSAVGIGWAVAAAAAAVPLLLSAHYARPVHALVEAMAGLTTTGATLVSDLDHLPVALNLWRHSLHPLGAVAILLVVATIRLHGDTMVATSSVAEAGQHRILPRHSRSLRDAIGLVAVWSVLGTVVLSVAAAVAGATPVRAIMHGVMLATSAFSTGGFTPTSASAGALHSGSVQVVLAVLMIAGATSLVLHRGAWTGRLRRVYLELDVRVLVVSGAGLLALLLLGLAHAGVQDSIPGLVSQGVFTLVAAHTTTGMSAVPARMLANGWGDLAPAALVVAMGIGGMTGSIAGGVGTLRVGLIAKGLVRDVRRLLLPESALVIERYHQHRARTLTDQHVRAAATVLLLMVVSVFAGSVVVLSMTPDGSLREALFAVTSTVSTTGLSVGFIGPTSTDATVLVSGALMWLGRLEFLAVFAGLGLLARGLPGVGGRR